MKTNIGWASHSLNFYNWYCTPVSAGCDNCYMFVMRKQFGREPKLLQWRDSAVVEYNRLNADDVVFVNSMSDTYHEAAPVEWIQRIHQMIAGRPDVTFLLLTKRPERALQLAPVLIWPWNLWLGVSVEKMAALERIDVLAQIPAQNRFLSVEPLLEDLLALGGVDRLTNYYDAITRIRWMIVGGESGNKRRPFDKLWARELQEFCNVTGTHFTFKQGGHRFPGKDNALDGEYYLSTPFVSNEVEVEQLDMFDDIPGQVPGYYEQE